MLAFSKGLHTNLGVAMGRREGFGAAIGREAISAQDICFLGVATDEESGDTLSESSRTTSGVGIERGKSFGDMGGEEVTDRGDETGGEGIDCCEAVFGFFACRVRICSCSLVLLSNLLLQRLHVYPSARFAAMRASSCCFNNSFASCFILLFIFNSCFRKW